MTAADVFSVLIGSIPKNTGLNEEGSVRGVLQLLKDSTDVSCIIFDDAKILELLTAMTKQTKDLTVILATSEFDFPMRFMVISRSISYIQIISQSN